MEPSSSISPHTEHVVDRPDVEAHPRMEPTGTNGRKATPTFQPWRLDRIFLLPTAPGGYGIVMATRRTSTYPVRCPVPRPPQASETQRRPLPKRNFAAAMAQVERP